MAGSVTRFLARHGTFAYETSAVTFATATKLNDISFDGNVASLKDVTVTLPKQEFEKIDCLGNLQQTIGANHNTVGTATGITPGYWQLQAMIAKSIGEVKFAGTMVVTGDEQFADILGLGTSQAITGGNTRYGIGTLTTGKALTQNLIGSLRLFLNNGSEELTAVGSNIHMSIGEIKPTGADGYYEVDFEAMCLAKDFAIEFKD